MDYKIYGCIDGGRGAGMGVDTSDVRWLAPWKRKVT